MDTKEFFATTQEDVELLLKPFLKEHVRRTTLKNGLTVILKEDHSTALVSTQLWFKTGSIYEDKLLSTGISHYVEHMLFKGTEKRTYKQISEDIHASGGMVNAYTTFDRTVYYVDIISEQLEVALDVLSDIGFHSTFPEEEVAQEQNVILREIDMGLDDPDHKVGYALFATAFNKHPYRYPVIGVRDAFLSLTREDLLQYYKERYIPNNAVLVIAGDFDPETILTQVEQYFASPSFKPLPSIVYPEDHEQLSRREVRLYGDYNLVRGSLAYKIPGLTHEDAPTLDILANALGQGQSSLLWQRLREERQIVYEISCSAWNPGSQGLFWISYTCAQGKREEVEDAILKELEVIGQEGIPKAMVLKAQRQAMVREINLRKTMTGQASRLGGAEVIVGDLDYPGIYLKRLSLVQAEDLTHVLKNYLQETKLTLVTLEPESAKTSTQGQARDAVHLPDFAQTTLSNGVRVLMQPVYHLPKVAIRTAFLGGGLYETREDRGSTSLMATMLTKDTQSRSAYDIAKLVESSGGGFGEFYGNNSFGLSVEVLSSDIGLALDILNEAYLKPLFKEEAFEIERTTQHAAIQEELDDIADYGRYILREKFFGEHPLSNNPLGTLQSVDSLTAKSIQAYWANLCVGGNMVVAVSGDFDPETLLQNLEHTLGKLPAKPFEQKNHRFSSPAQPGMHTVHMDREQAVVFQAYRDCGVLHEDFDTGDVLDEILSGLSSHLFIKVREEQGLAYYVGASRIAGLHEGMFYFYAGTHPDQHEAVFKAMQDEVERLKIGNISDEEIQRCKVRLKAKKRMSLQSPGSRAAQACLDYLYGFPANYWKTYSDRIDQVTKEAVVAFANKYFLDEEAVKLVVMPKKG